LESSGDWATLIAKPSPDGLSDIQNPWYLVGEWYPNPTTGLVFDSLYFLLHLLLDGEDTDSGESESSLIIRVKAEMRND